MLNFPAFLALLTLGGLIDALPGEEARPLLLVFDFSSEYDQSREGRRVGSILRARARKTGQFETLEDMDFEEMARKHGLGEGAGMDSAAVEKMARECGASWVIWGEVRQQGETLEITARMMDPRDGGGEKVREETFRADGRQGVSAACEKLLAALHPPAAPATRREGLPREAEEAWKTSANLCRNGDFEQGEPFPGFWRVLREDCGPYVSGVPVPGRVGRCLRYDLPEAIAANQGIMAFSTPIPVEVGGTYRVQVNVLTRGPTLIFFIKGYAWVQGTGNESFSWREAWNRKQTLPAKTGEWTACQTDLHPGMDVLRKGQPMPLAHRLRFIRIGLYAYWPKGEVFWDDVVLKKLLPATQEFRTQVQAMQKEDAMDLPAVPED
ncbi:MAG: hypothetical protein HYU36_10320 [Planctomycetes bacterium]|nr:hypothetical protein [Planctomycetota bacterium]